LTSPPALATVAGGIEAGLRPLQEMVEMPIRPAAILLAAGALASCADMPLYSDSLDWFSRSRYDPEVDAIERQTPAPVDSPVLAPGAAALAVTPRLAAGGAGRAVPRSAATPPVVTPAAAAGSAALVATADSEPQGPAVERFEVVPAVLPARERITPHLGFARAKRVIYGANRGPFPSATVRAPR
jgi:hypothetical protein